MVRIRHSSWVVVALVAGFAGAAFAQPAKKLPAKAADDLALIPMDSEVVGGLDFAQVQTSKLWKQFVEPQLAKNEVRKQIDEFKTNCGVDPMKSVTKMSFGMKGIGNPNPDGVIVAHGVPKAKLTACFDKMVKAKQGQAKIVRDGDIVTITTKDNQPVAFMFLDDSTALVVVGTQANTAGVKGIAKGTSTLRTSAAFSDLHKKTNTNDTLWMIINGNSKAFDQMRGMGMKPKAVFGSVNVTKDLTMDLRMRMESAGEATNIASMMQSQVKGAAGMFDKLQVSSDGADVKALVVLSDAKLQGLLKTFGATP
ncbi:MAG TPA: hypothetical protein VFQ53_28965 [Kofleriaceae bacterium]|nr:hypothetical protein [Kofleriaceae bacterium]